MTKLATITNHLDVSDEQIGMAHLILHKDGNFYQVESSQDCTVEYAVRYVAGKGFSCECKSGLNGWANVKHASGVCWHVRAAVACSIEVKSAMREQEQLQAQATAQPVATYTDQDTATLARVMSSTGQKISKRASLPASKPFSILR